MLRFPIKRSLFDKNYPIHNKYIGNYRQKEVKPINGLNQKNGIKKNNIAVLLLVTIIGISLFFSDFLTIESIKNNKVWIKEFVDNNYVFSVFLFFLSCLIFVNSPIPLAALTKILGGFFFGFHMGAIYNISATILACLLGFTLSRYAFKEAFEKAYYDRLRKIEREIETNGFYYFVTIRIVMVVPYFLINILAGISRISVKTFVLSTILGVLPASLIYANGGHKLEEINSITDLFKADIIISLIAVAFVSLLPLFIKKRSEEKS